MRTQITCPDCRTQYAADVYQIVDVGQNPELKEALISGYLNVAQCPACGAVTQFSGPLLYHDPTHELFMVHIPIEMGLSLEEQEKLIGKMIQEAMDSLTPSDRRGYMLQPQMVLTMQTLMEKVYATEGITPEMIAKQRDQSELLQKMIGAEKNDLTNLINENQELIDESFFTLLRAIKEAADESSNEEISLKLTNIQARLYRTTDAGRRLEKQQRVLREFSLDVEKSSGLTQELLLKHIMANKSDDSVVATLVMSGQQAFDYQFFLLLSERIEKRQKAGIDASELLALREKLLNLQQEMEDRAKKELATAQDTLQSIVNASDRVSAVKTNLSKIDNTVLYVLSVNLQQAEQRGDTEALVTLQEIQTIISNQMEDKAPPEIRMINSLVQTQDFDEQQRILDENSELISPELVQVLKMLVEDSDGRGQEELRDRLKTITSLIESRLDS